LQTSDGRPASFAHSACSRHHVSFSVRAADAENRDGGASAFPTVVKAYQIWAYTRFRDKVTLDDLMSENFCSKMISAHL
jgi:hypothetical protein